MNTIYLKSAPVSLCPSITTAASNGRLFMLQNTTFSSQTAAGGSLLTEWLVYFKRADRCKGGFNVRDQAFWVAHKKWMAAADWPRHWCPSTSPSIIDLLLLWAKTRRLHTNDTEILQRGADVWALWLMRESTEGWELDGAFGSETVHYEVTKLIVPQEYQQTLSLSWPVRHHCSTCALVAMQAKSLPSAGRGVFFHLPHRGPATPTLLHQ